MVKPNVTPLCVHHNLWQCIEGGSKSEYSIIENFSLRTSVGSKLGWLYNWDAGFGFDHSSLVYETWEI